MCVFTLLVHTWTAALESLNFRGPMLTTPFAIVWTASYLPKVLGTIIGVLWTEYAYLHKEQHGRGSRSGNGRV